MTTSFPSDAEIAAEIAQYPTRSLSDALDDMVTRYLCFENEEGSDEAKHRYRKLAYYQSYYPFTHEATWWKRLYWHYYKKVDHPHFPEKTSLEEAAKFFIWMGRQSLHTKLLKGEAKAFGYHMPRKPLDLPVPVPSDVWGEDMSASGIDWEKSLINENGLPLCAVQIVFSDDYELTDVKVDEVNTASPTLTTKKLKRKKRGRPTLSVEIDEAISFLFAHKRISPDDADLAQVEVVRSQVNLTLNLPEDNSKNLGEDVITDHLRVFFRPFRTDKNTDK